MLESKVTTTPWTEEEEDAFTVAMGAWIRTWFTHCRTSGRDVMIGPKTEELLAQVWRAGQEYEAGKEKT